MGFRPPVYKEEVKRDASMLLVLRHIETVSRLGLDAQKEISTMELLIWLG